MADVAIIIEKIPASIDVQICFSLEKQGVTIIELRMPCQSTIRDAFNNSQISKKYREIDINVYKVGIFGKLKTLNTILRQGDRVEIYRPLTADPMEARRRRFAKQLKVKPTA